MQRVPTKIKRRAQQLGASDIQVSERLNKEFKVLYRGRWIHFGDNRYADYTTHKDDVRRKNYRRRASKITNKGGQFTYRLKNTPNYWAYNLLW